MSDGSNSYLLYLYYTSAAPSDEQANDTLPTRPPKLGVAVSHAEFRRVFGFALQVNVALCQLAVGADKEANITGAESAIRSAASKGADLVCGGRSHKDYALVNLKMTSVYAAHDVMVVCGQMFRV